MHAEKNVPSRVWAKALKKVQIQGPMVLKDHGIGLARGIEKGARGVEGSWYFFGPWY